MWLLALALALGSGLLDPAPAQLPAANTAARCQWPTVVAMRAGEAKCSGVLVAPDVVLTAGHCLAEGMPGKMRFGESFSPTARAIDVAQCWRLDPSHDQPPAALDLGVCELVAAATDLAATPILTECEATAIAEGETAVVVGYGLEAAGGTYGTKRYAFTRMQSDLEGDGTFLVGDGQVGGCDGDSGGPAFVQLSDGSWRVAGIISGGPTCGEGPSRYVAPHVHTAWLEATTRRDLRPCRDEAGAWTGGDGCVVDGAPGGVGRSWDQWCAGVQLTPLDTCTPADEEPGSSTGTPSADTGDPTGESTGAATGLDAASATSSTNGCSVCGSVPGGGAWLWLIALASRRRQLK